MRTTFAAFLATAMLAGPAAWAQTILTAETASPDTAPHVSILHLAEVAEEAGIATLQVQVDQTLSKSVVDVAEGTLDITAVPLILPFLLNIGRGPYAGLGAEGAELASNLRALYPYNAGGFGLIALESEGIESWDDLAGKTVWNGPPLGAALLNARQAIQGASGLRDGEDYVGYQSDWSLLPSLLADGSMDAFVMPLTWPSERVMALGAAGNVVIVSTPREVFESEVYQGLFAAPGNVPIEVKWEDMGYGEDSGVRLISEDGTFRGLGTAFAEVVNKDMPFDTARDLTAAYIAGLDRLKARTAYARNIGAGVLDPKLSGFCGVNPLKYHAGAVAAWEAAGYDVADCLKPDP